MELEKKIRCLKKIFDVCQEMLEDGESNQQIVYSLCATGIILLEKSNENEVDPYLIHGQMVYILHHAMQEYVAEQKEEKE